MPMTKMTDLKEVFSGISSFMFDTTPIASASSVTLNPEIELPVTVDTLSISQDDPTINHYKVHGLGTDWVSTSEPGDATIEFTVPSVHADVLNLAYGSSTTASQTFSAAIEGAVKSIEAKTYSGKSITLSNTKLTGCIALLSDDGNNLLIVNNVALYASPVFDNASTEPFAFKFSGTIEAGTGASIYFLKKQQSQ